MRFLILFLTLSVSSFAGYAPRAGGSGGAGAFDSLTVKDADGNARATGGNGIVFRYGGGFSAGTQGIQLDGANLNMSLGNSIVFSASGGLLWSGDTDWYHTKDVALVRVGPGSLAITDTVDPGFLTVNSIILNGGIRVSGRASQPPGSFSGNPGDLVLTNAGGGNPAGWIKDSGTDANGWYPILGPIPGSPVMNNMLYQDGSHIYWRTPAGADYQLDP